MPSSVPRVEESPFGAVVLAGIRGCPPHGDLVAVGHDAAPAQPARRGGGEPAGGCRGAGFRGRLPVAATENRQMDRPGLG
jgi:hypothetical protein